MQVLVQYGLADSYLIHCFEGAASLNNEPRARHKSDFATVAAQVQKAVCGILGEIHITCNGF
jgi:hypothetical protein